jgi:hypothetical protein
MSKNNSRPNSKGFYGKNARAARAARKPGPVTDDAVARHFGLDDATVERRRQANMQRRAQAAINRAKNLRASRQPFNGLDLSAFKK